ncbi:MAG TPA: Calx-beta domain-containing protein [Pyrinomonadaceae bacterium]|nr:Calx-beta domain-containing protein [Pyrinomonadaceae bacterium]
MNHLIASLVRRNRRAFFVSLLSYMLLLGQTAPLALASNSPATRAAALRAALAGETAGDAPAPVVTAAAPAPAPLAPAAAVLVPTITATKTDTIVVDGGNDGIAEPGDLIEYQITITNNGTDATNVTLTDTVDTNTTLQGGTTKATPLAYDDTYSVLGNVRIQVPDGASDLLANDQDPDTGNNTGMTATAETKKSAQCGACATDNVTINADGSFSYDPPPGFTGADTFDYTASSAGDTNTATVTLNVAGMIWFVNAAAGTGGDGRLTSPFNCLVGTGCFDTVAADEAGDNIFLFVGTYSDTGALTLLNTQKLIGQGASDTLQTISGVTVPPHSDALPSTNEPAGTNPTPPTITSTANAINLGQNNVLRGFNVGNVPNASIKINGAGFGQLTIGKTTEPDVSLGGTGRALSLQNGTLAATSGLGPVASTGSSGAAAVLLTQITAGALTFLSTTVSGASAGGVEVNGSSADINFGNTDVAAGTDGVALANNPAGTRSFGTLSITGGTGIGFRHFDPDGAGAGVGGGAVSVTGATSITNPAGVGIDVDSSNANLSFAATTVNKNSTGNIGVDLTNNATRTIGFTSLAVTTTTGFALNTNNSGTVNAGGGSLTQSGAGGGAASLTNTALGLTFTSVSSTSGGNGLIFNTGSGTFASGTTNLQSNAGVGLLMSSTSVAANFGNTTVNASAGDAVDLSNNTGNITFAALNLSPNANLRGLDASGNTGTITSTSGNVTTTGAPAINISGPAGRTPLSMVLTNVDSTNSTLQGVLLNLVSGNFTVNDPGTATNIQNSTGNGIEVTNTGAGTINFGNTTVNATGNANGDDTGTGIRLTNNAAALTFGALTVTPDSGERGLFANDTDATAAGAITIASGTITTTNDVAVEITGQATGNRTPLNVQLTTVNTTGGSVATHGIVLTNTSATASPGGFRVLGTGGTCTQATPTCTGGRITATTGAGDITPDDNNGIGVRVVNANQIFLTRMRIDNHPNFAIHGSGVVGFNLDNSVLDGTNGNELANEEGVIRLRELTGTTGASTASNITNNFISGGQSFQIDVRNFNGGTLDRLNVNNNIFGALNNAGDDAVHFEGFGNPVTFNVTFNNNVVPSGRGDLVNYNVGSAGNNVTSDFVMRNNTMHNVHPAILSGGGGVTVTMGGGATINSTYDISCNSIRGSKGFGLLVAKTLGGGTAQGTIFNNRIGVDGVVSSGSSEASGMDVDTRGSGTHTVLIKNNQVHQWAANGGFQIFNNQGNATMNVTLQGNLTNNPQSPNGLAGLYAEVGALAGDTSVLNILVGGAGAAENNFVEGDPANASDVLLSRIAGGGTTLNLSRGVSAASTVQQIITDNNADPVVAASAGTITFVNTVPALPPATDQTCSAPTGAVFFDSETGTSGGIGSVENSDIPTGLNAEMPSGAPATTMGGVTSQPFVSLPRNPTTTTTQTGNTLAPVAQETVTTTATTQTPQAERAEIAPPKPPVIAGNQLTWNVGTLQAGQSVTITFRVQVNNPYTGGPNVSNQGSITCTECGGAVLTDDPAAGGAADPTLTPVNSSPDIAISNASGPEPPSGSNVMAFTVVLSKPSATNVTVNFTTAEDTGGTDPATEGTDFTPTTGTLTFTPGQTVQTISVPVLADLDAPEPDETFLVQLTGSTGGNITDGEAVGTITAANPAGTILISEIRTFGPGGAGDDFVEIYNNTETPHTVTASDASAGYGIFRMGASCTDTPVLIGTIPNGTIIPARGHFLLVGSQYSLTAAATGNLTMSTDLGENSNVGIFNTDSVAALSTATRLDAVGFATNTGNNCDLLREGGILPAVNSGAAGLDQHSFYRSLCSFVPGPGCTVANPGFPSDRNDNASDFLFVDTNATEAAGPTQRRLGAPGPENIASARVNDQIGAVLLDATKTSSAVPNRVRKLCGPAEECDPNRSQFGTMSIRKRLTNNTGATVTQLRVRVVELTTFPRPDGATADIRPISSIDVVATGVNDPATCAANGTPATAPCDVTVKGTTVQAPTQVNGGGYNSTMIVTLPGGGLPNGGSVSLQFLLGIQQTGNFRFLLNVETLP